MEKNIEKISVNAELIITLYSKNDWIKKCPNHLPEKSRVEIWLWIDINGNCLTIGEDFMAAEKQNSYPVKVYRIQRTKDNK